MITKYCRWCKAPFATLSECWRHQAQCVDGDYDHEMEEQRIRELTVDWKGTL